MLKQCIALFNSRRWHGVAVVCVVSALLLANYFSNRMAGSFAKSELNEQAASLSKSDQRCCGIPWKVKSGKEPSDAELYKMWVYPVTQQHERTLPFLKPVEIYGNANARLCIRAFYPFHRGHEHFKYYFRKLAERYYPYLRVECINFGTPTGFKLFRKEGLSCGTVMLHGYPQVKAKFNGVELPIVFEGPMDEAWQREDLELLIMQLITISNRE